MIRLPFDFADTDPLMEEVVFPLFDFESAFECDLAETGFLFFCLGCTSAIGFLRELVPKC